VLCHYANSTPSAKYLVLLFQYDFLYSPKLQDRIVDCLFLKNVGNGNTNMID
jgi:hypothetical protein